MRILVALILWGSVLGSAFAVDRFLELRAPANLYAEPSRTSNLVAKLRPGVSAERSPFLLKLLQAKRTNGYYNVAILGGAERTGWVYKSYVRGFDEPAPSQISSATVSTGLPGSSFGACKVLFPGGKPPVAPEEYVPLCEEDGGLVFFASGYSKRANHGYWSAYRLDEELIQEMKENPLERPKIKFRQNPKLEDGQYVQPRHDSYTRTEWDRGHLAPNGAMSWDVEAQKRSFMISNIAPQKPAMNRNIWRCFEQSIREWAATSGDTYVTVGTTKGEVTISSDRDPDEVAINVPSHFFAVVYRTKPKTGAIGVLVPNEEGHLDIRKNMMSVSELEQKTKFQFNLPASVKNERPEFKQWPTRIVKKELLGKLPSIDVQCPRV